MKTREDADRMTLDEDAGLGKVTKHHIAVLRVLMGSLIHSFPYTYEQKVNAMRRYREGIEFSLLVLRYRMRGVTGGGTRAVAARAFYAVGDRERVERFFHVLTAPEDAQRGDGAPLLLFKHLIQESESGTRAATLEKYLKTERALDAYIRDEKVTRLYAAPGELFLLPGEPMPKGMRPAAIAAQ